jgi:hypothetical protein
MSAEHPVKDIQTESESDNDYWLNNIVVLI